MLLSGTIVKRASLHNEDIMQELDIHQGDSLYIWKAGEIIRRSPAWNSLRVAGAAKIEFVHECPECGTPLRRIFGEASWVCPSKYGCRPQITGRIGHFCARRMMDIDGIGEETAELLYACGLVKNIGDLYPVSTRQNSRDLTAWEKRPRKRIMAGIEASKQVPFERVLYALSIPNVGGPPPSVLPWRYRAWSVCVPCRLRELTAVPDIGPVIARNIHDFLREPVNVANIDVLTAAGLRMEVDTDRLASAGNALEGKTIVISGSFSRHSRDEYKDIIMAQGGKTRVAYRKRQASFSPAKTWGRQSSKSAATRRSHRVGR